MKTHGVGGSPSPDEEPTLPDLLTPGLQVVFIGINPSRFSVERGHYFARPANRFWAALSASRLSERARIGLGRHALVPEDDRSLPAFGIGFTDIVKRPTASASELRAADFANGAPQLRARLMENAPRIACFQGATALRPFLRYALDVRDSSLDFGLQPLKIGETRIFLTPNPSPANASYRLADLVTQLDSLADEPR
ncbi:MAG TPA: mismatch-specific DNA-glycosylase [Nitrolancea sp.]